jgi:hypothetical protein
MDSVVIAGMLLNVHLTVNTDMSEITHSSRQGPTLSPPCKDNSSLGVRTIPLFSHLPFF